MRKLKTKILNDYDVYLIFMLLAYSGAFLWQMFLPSLANDYSTWGTSIGWQREIALWNIGIITAIIYAFVKKAASYKRILTLQSFVLCAALGLNHAFSLLTNFSLQHTLHILGVFEVLIIGGIWGSIVFFTSKN